jgi:hypothetical protein
MLTGIPPSKSAPSGVGPEGLYLVSLLPKAVTGTLRVAATAAARKPMESALASRHHRGGRRRDGGRDEACSQAGNGVGG